VAEELSLARKATFEDVTLASSGVASPLLISYSRELQKELDLNQLDIQYREGGREAVTISSPAFVKDRHPGYLSCRPIV